MTPLLKSLQGLQEDRGAMAALRKALTEQQQRAYRYLPRLGCKFADQSDMLRACIIAHCWGHHPMHADTIGNLGYSMHWITGGDEKNPFNRRFERLIACDSLDEIAEQLRGIVSLLKRDSIPINYNKFADDLFWFPRNPDRTKREWSGGFYLQEVEA